MTINRKCIGCNKLHDRNKMFRLLKSHKDGLLIFSPTNKEFGRSVYICKNKECINTAYKTGRITRFSGKNQDLIIKTELENLLIKEK